MMKFEDVTTEAFVDIYSAAEGVFEALLQEVDKLSRKKPDATLSKSKVTIINKVLDDLLKILTSEPEGKYLQSLEDSELPQVSDALMMMVQFDAALKSFKKRYHKFIKDDGLYGGHHVWITEEALAKWDAEEPEIETD